MSEYSLTNNAFQPELNRNNLVKFVDLHAKWVGIIDNQEISLGKCNTYAKTAHNVFLNVLLMTRDIL